MEEILVKIQTKAFGEIEVSDKQKISFPDGILGFEFIKDYYLLDMEDSPFYWLQSIEEQDIAFVVIQPDLFIPDYKLKVNNAELESIDIKDKEDILIFTIVTIPENPSEMTANLQGPIIINKKNNLARQAISLDDNHRVKHALMKADKSAIGGSD
ncbi:MAG: flagellar assembly protein FliW [Spirochaetes bacterium]|nr:flagellar assembly protein FliW [Spirochaetota bacterium]MCK5267046.1 flagellar assembly protein FliW [Spirochaetota bacterium]